MAYSIDADLVKIKSNILDLGVSSWSDQQTEAEAIIDRTLENKWYKIVAGDYNVDYRETAFNKDLLLDAETQLTRLSCYKTFELAYLYLQKDTEQPDGFERQRQVFAALYLEELEHVLSLGLNYDWDGSGGLTYDEKYTRTRRVLQRG